MQTIQDDFHFDPALSQICHSPRTKRILDQCISTPDATNAQAIARAHLLLTRKPLCTKNQIDNIVSERTACLRAPPRAYKPKQQKRGTNMIASSSTSTSSHAFPNIEHILDHWYDEDGDVWYEVAPKQWLPAEEIIEAGFIKLVNEYNELELVFEPSIPDSLGEKIKALDRFNLDTTMMLLAKTPQELYKILQETMLLYDPDLFPTEYYAMRRILDQICKRASI